MNIAEAFADYLVNLGKGTLGQNIFIGQAPSSNRVSDSIWWIVGNGGSSLQKNSTGESLKNYQLSVYYRNRDYKTVYDTLSDLEESINCDGCAQLDSFDTIDIEASTFPVDNDLDNEDRKVGLLQVNLTTYKECI
jgi:hypothetical protein